MTITILVTERRHKHVKDFNKEAGAVVVVFIFPKPTTDFCSEAAWTSVEFSFLLPALGCSPGVVHWREGVAGTIRMRNDGEAWANLQGSHRGEF